MSGRPCREPSGDVIWSPNNLQQSLANTELPNFISADRAHGDDHDRVYCDYSDPAIVIYFGSFVYYLPSARVWVSSPCFVWGLTWTPSADPGVSHRSPSIRRCTLPAKAQSSKHSFLQSWLCSFFLYLEIKGINNSEWSQWQLKYLLQKANCCIKLIIIILDRWKEICSDFLLSFQILETHHNWLESDHLGGPALPQPGHRKEIFQFVYLAAFQPFFGNSLMAALDWHRNTTEGRERSERQRDRKAWSLD